MARKYCTGVNSNCQEVWQYWTTNSKQYTTRWKRK